MLLKVGIALMLLSLTLAAGVATVVTLRSQAPEEPATLPAEPQSAEVTTAEEKEYDLGQKLELEEDMQAEQTRREQTQREQSPRKEPEPRQEEPKSQPASVPDWPRPSDEEIAAAQGPRYYPPVRGTTMTLTIEALGIYDVPVVNDDSTAALDTGVVHVPETSFPWDGGAQRNVYLAGHRLGYPGTGSRLIFYELDELRSGDEIILEDSLGGVYRYRVSESFTTSPDESWMMGQVVNRDMLTLQTCTPIPTFEELLIVRADRV